MKAAVLIVDDEPTICRGLSVTIPWSELGAEVIGEAYDGSEALEILGETPADLIITDVKMPNMNGLELAEELHNAKNPAKIVMLSGYEEFAYVKKALKFGVRDYLLKPVDTDELIALVRKLLAEIRDEAVRNKQRKLEACYRYIANEMIEKTGSASAECPTPAEPCRIVISRFTDCYKWLNDASGPEANSMRAFWKEQLDRALRESGLQAVSLFLQANLLLTVIPEDRISLLSIQALKELINGCVSEMPPQEWQLEWTISERLVPIEDVKDEVERIFEQFGLLHRSGEARGLPADYPKETEKRLLEQLFQHKDGELWQTMDELFEYFYNNGCSGRNALQICQEMFLMIERRFRDTAGLKEAVHRLPNLKNVDLNIYSSLTAIRHLFQNAIVGCSALLKEANHGRNRWIIERVKAYIHQNYAMELKSCQVAEMIHLTPNYFSSIFKQETGKSFNEYLNEVRLEKAKQLLLETSERVGTIAIAVGYKEYKYFSMLFKKYTGFIPTEFRALHCGSYR